MFVFNFYKWEMIQARLGKNSLVKTYKTMMISLVTSVCDTFFLPFYVTKTITNDGEKFHARECKSLRKFILSQLWCVSHPRMFKVCCFGKFFISFLRRDILGSNHNLLLIVSPIFVSM